MGARSIAVGSWATVAMMLAPALLLAGGLGYTSVSRAVGSDHPFVVPAAVHPRSFSCSSSGLCVGDVRTAYNFTSAVTNRQLNGTGETIVIVDACGDSKLASDLTAFDKGMGIPDPKLTVLRYSTAGGLCSNSGWSLETALDVEWSHAVAPGAAIEMIEGNSPTNSALYGAWGYALSHHLGNQISNSWGGTSSCGSKATSLLNTAATAHVTVLASAGDSGAWGSGTFQGSQSPADCLKILTVGGTTLSLGSGSTYSSESAWSGSGGGYAGSTSEPSYESTVKISDSYKELAKPEVAAVADPSTGVWVYDTAYGGWNVVGGTSVACPIWAGLTADVNSLRAANGFAAAGSYGAYLFLHVYGISGGSGNYSAELHDVTSGSNGWSAGTGWDPATGLGSMNAYPFIQQLGSDSSA